MSKIVGIQFRNRGNVYDFASGHFVLKKGDKVMVVTEEGPAIGCVSTEPQIKTEDGPDRKLKKIFRLATKEEVERYDKCCQLEEKVFNYCYHKVREKSIPMSLVSVERRFDGSKIVIFFTADGRVDFRELVKDLVGQFRTKIEMRQIGVRHQAKMVGGIGVCGKSLCCSSHLKAFAPVTIKMAKMQNISLNPSKISGMCGRLMCCLTYEYEYYDKTSRKIPKIGQKVETAKGEGKIIRRNILKEEVTVLLDSGEEMETPASALETQYRPPTERPKTPKRKKRRSTR